MKKKSRNKDLEENVRVNRNRMRGLNLQPIIENDAFLI